MTEQCRCGENCPCRQQCKCGESCNCPENFLRLADEAWMELLKEKIKAEIDKRKGSDIQQLAEIVAKGNGERWKHKMAAKIGSEEYKTNLQDYYMKK